jgi:MFS transporter, FHS family, L-fucose permease
MKRNPFIVALVFLIFFAISLITNVLGAIIPDIKESFNLSRALVGFLPASFFVAYFMSIPAGMLIERIGEKPVLILSFTLALAGSLFLALSPSFSVALTSLFVIGIGMAMLQVVINPLLRVAGGEEHFAFYSVMAQLVFGLASYLSPLLYRYFVDGLKAGGTSDNQVISLLSRVVPPGMAWISVYWLFAAVSGAMLLLLLAVRLPRVELKEDERVGTFSMLAHLLRNKTVILYFIGVFAYVGTEQGTCNWISQFLKEYHGWNPETQGASAVSWFWGLLLVGCLLGLGLLKLFDSRKILVVFVLAAMIALSVALFTSSRTVSLWAFPVVGFCLSVMWSIVFSLALNSLDKHHGSFSGILCTGVIGGAVVPPLIGFLGDQFGLRAGMVFIYLTLAYLLGIGIWARPLINNATINQKKTEASV